jgi:hypothetical protein
MIGLTAGLIALATGTYADTLLDLVHRRYPEIVSAQIAVTRRDNQPLVVERHWTGASKRTDKRILLDASGDEIGTVSVNSACAVITNADEIARMLSRRIYSPSSLAEPDPYVAGAIRAPNAQAIIDDALERDPTIITLAFHVTPPGRTLNAIVASNFGRIGKVADSDDDKVVRNGETLREVTNAGKRVAVELPLLDSDHNIIGALSTSFKVTPGTPEGAAEVRAVALRNELSRRTPTIRALFQRNTVSRQVAAVGTCSS